MCEATAIQDVLHLIFPMHVRFCNRAMRWQRPSPRRIGRIGCGCVEVGIQTENKIENFVSKRETRGGGG